jgi:hypothetical protein
MQNYNRLDLNKSIFLKAGTQIISLSISVPYYHAPVYLRSLELLPLFKSKENRAEQKEAESELADASWLVHAGYGLMFHWDNTSVPRSGLPLEYSAAVRAFDVKSFLDMVSESGASYVIFTANHGGSDFPASLKECSKTTLVVQQTGT